MKRIRAILSIIYRDTNFQLSSAKQTMCARHPLYGNLLAEVRFEGDMLSIARLGGLPGTAGAQRCGRGRATRMPGSWRWCWPGAGPGSRPGAPVEPQLAEFVLELARLRDSQVTAVCRWSNTPALGYMLTANDDS